MNGSNEKQYEYAIVRYVPRIDRGEFINVGLVMMCKREGWCKAEIKIDEDRLRRLPALHSPEELEKQLSMFTKVAHADSSAGPIAKLQAEERFRWLTAVKSSALQTSRPHPGLTDDLEGTFLRLYKELVL